MKVNRTLSHFVLCVFQAVKLGRVGLRLLKEACDSARTELVVCTKG